MYRDYRRHHILDMQLNICISTGALDIHWYQHILVCVWSPAPKFNVIHL